MPHYSETSKANLKTTHWKIQKIFNKAIQTFDHSILCGHRGVIAQNDAYQRGFSRVQWPHSMHNKHPSLAVDAIPYPAGFDDIAGMYFFGGYIWRLAQELEIPIRWGGNWDCDTDFDDENFRDLAHFELIMPKGY